MIEDVRSRQRFGGLAMIVVLVTVALAGVCMLTVRPVLGETRMTSYGINQFGDSDECNGSRLWWSVGFAEVARDVFEDWGWGTVKFYKNEEVDGRDWTDYDKGNGAGVKGEDYDTDGADHAHVAFLSSHGGKGDNYVYAMMGDGNNSSEVCNPNSKSHWQFGNHSESSSAHDGSARVVVLATCHSGSYGAFGSGAFDTVADADGAFTTLLAFHGVSHDTPWDKAHVKDYFKHAEYNGIGKYWLIDMYADRSGYEQCPVAIIFADSHDSAAKQFEDGGYKDFKDTGAKNTAYYFWIGECDPEGADKLPSH